MNSPRKLAEIYAYQFPTGSGVFADLQKLGVPWQSENIAEQLDAYFYGTFAGRRFAAYPLMTLADAHETGTLDDDNREAVALYLFKVFGTNWQKMFDTMSFEYDPISNYDMTETENGTDDGTETRNLKSTNTGNVDTTTNATSSGSVYGFNSAASVPATSGTNGGSDNETRNLEGTDTGTVDRTTTRERTLTRKGNIGVTTSQQMIQSERELWLWNYFRDTVFPDVARALTLDIY